MHLTKHLSQEQQQAHEKSFEKAATPALEAPPPPSPSAAPEPETATQIVDEMEPDATVDPGPEKPPRSSNFQHFALTSLQNDSLEKLPDKDFDRVLAFAHASTWSAGCGCCWLFLSASIHFRHSP